MVDKGQKYYHGALLLGLMIHLPALFFTFESTYDSYVHIFFAEHYASNWFENWNYKWYTGFTITSYPPLVHQIVAMLSYLVGLKLAFVIWSLCAVFLFIRGVYVFSQLWVDQHSAGYAAILAVVSGSFVEALHIFGQVPSITGMSLLLNACPHVYQWLRENKWQYYLIGLLLICVTTSAHHVTTIFGMVFFLMPVMGLALIDRLILDKNGITAVNFKDFLLLVKQKILKAVFFGLSVIFAAVIMILPYWLWSKSDPISQVSIPHGSRDSYLEVLSSGMVFFLIPWGMILFVLPYIFKELYVKRNIFLALSFTLLLVLGTGGTTPIPKMILGETAFNILTLDRFTFWASIIALPFWGKFFYSMLNGTYGMQLINLIGRRLHSFSLGLYVITILVFAGFIMNMGYFRPFQPQKIDVQPIVNFLNSDNHDRWRYLTLGFGDQVAWLTANTKALSVDGNYHSARRLPELTTRKVERLENAKYLGMQGIGALQQFLTIPEKYNLKYIFCNDKFYEPILNFSGWTRVEKLANGIDVWERSDVPVLPKVLPRKNIPSFQKYMWGTLPLTVAVITLLSFLILGRYLHIKYLDDFEMELISHNPAKSGFLGKHKLVLFNSIWAILLLIIMLGFGYYLMNRENPQNGPKKVIVSYFDALDFRYFDTAYAYISDDDKPPMEIFMASISAENGMINSYAKLNGIETEILSQTESTAKVKVRAEWLTSVQRYHSDHIFRTKKEAGKWHIIFEEINQYAPPNQFFRVAEINFTNQGRRQISDSETKREDIIDRPEMLIPQASLMKLNDTYAIVGEITNTDNDPAFISVEGVLYDQYQQEIIRYNARDVMKHWLLPKETTSFKIEFEEMAFQNIKSKLPEIFDPELDSPYKFLAPPVTAAVFVKSMVTDAYLYKYSGINDIQLTNNGLLQAKWTNYGPQEVAIPQVLINYKFQDQIVWSDKKYLSHGVRSQRYRSFDVDLIDLSEIEEVYRLSRTDKLVNGYLQKETLNQKIDNKAECITVDDMCIELLTNGFVDL